MKHAIPIALGTLLCTPCMAFAHSFAMYASTPISPPGPFAWLWPVSLVVLASSVFIAFKLIIGTGWVEATVVSIVAVLSFAVLFYAVGSFWAASTTAPPPGLGPPGAIYRRWAFPGLVAVFIFWNAVGMGTIAASVFLTGRLWSPARQPRRALVLAIPTAVYVLLLVPFVTKGALVHGWAGGHVMTAANSQLDDLNHACFRYAHDHDGKFPVAADIHELMPLIEPYLKRLKSRYGNPIYVHPAAWVFEESPEPYQWNAQLSGQDAPELPVFDENSIPVTCPYTPFRPVFEDEDR